MPDKTVSIRLSFSSDFVSKDSITHIDHLLLTTDLSYLSGNRFASFFKKPKTVTFSNLKSIEPGVFRLDSVSKAKYYLILDTQIDSTDLNLSNYPFLDLTKIDGNEARFDFKLDKTFVRRYYDTEK